MPSQIPFKSTEPRSKNVRPFVELHPDLEESTQRALRALGLTNDPPSLFAYGGGLARIEHDERQYATVRMLTPLSLRQEMARRATWGSKGKNGVRLKYPPMALVHNLMAIPRMPFPVLSRILRAPGFSADGVLQAEPGYNRTTQTYYAPAPGFVLTPVPDSPTASDVQQAAEAINDVLADFPFASAADYAHAIAFQITPFAGGLIEGPVPLFAIDKPTPGSGAGLLSDVLLFPSQGTSIAKMTEGESEAEWRKRLTAALLSGAPAILIDNVRQPLTSAALASALTEESITDRVLGSSQLVTLPGHRLFLVTANNLVVSDEIRRRLVRIRLNPQVEQPELRTGFRHDGLMTYVKSRRAELAWAACVLIQAWIRTGRPAGQGTMGRFEGWVRVIGGVLDVAGIPGFLGNMDDVRRSMDAFSTAWAALMQSWHYQFSGTSVTTSQVLAIVDDDLADSLQIAAPTDQGVRTKLGQLIVRMRDRVANGYRLVEAGHFQGSRLWKIEFLK